MVAQVTASAAQTRAGSARVLRFRACERALHWSIAIPFLVCMVSAAILVLIYNPDPNRPYRDLVSWTHRISGIALGVFPVMVLALFWREAGVHLQNIRAGWISTVDDVKWLMLMPLAAMSSVLPLPAAVRKRLVLPEAGKFNAGEKINFMMTSLTPTIYFVTGILIWTKVIDVVAPWLVHFSLAILTLPVVFGHIFMATINPSTRKGLSGMFSGFVDREWARHHYPKWYRQQFDRDEDMRWYREQFLSARVGAREENLLPPRSGKSPWDEEETEMLTRSQRVMRAAVELTPVNLFLAAVVGLSIFLLGIAAESTSQLATWIAVPESAARAGAKSPPPATAGKAPPGELPAVLVLSEDAPLRSKPRDDAEPVPGGILVAGDRVTPLMSADAFILIKDAEGRAGYLPAAILAPDPHAPTPRKSH